MKMIASAVEENQPTCSTVEEQEQDKEKEESFGAKVMKMFGIDEGETDSAAGEEAVAAGAGQEASSASKVNDRTRLFTQLRQFRRSVAKSCFTQHAQQPFCFLEHTIRVSSGTWSDIKHSLTCFWHCFRVMMA